MAYHRVTWEDGQTALSAEHMNNIEDGIGEALVKAQGNTDMWAYIRDLVYPVGSIYMSATLSTKEAVEDLLGGTWEAWGAGRVPVGVGTADGKTFAIGETGGQKDAIIPSHNHTATFAGTALAKHTHTFTGTAVAAHTHTGPSHAHSISAQSISVSGTGSGTTTSNGGHSHIYERVWTTTFTESGSDTQHTCISSAGGSWTEANGVHTHDVTVGVGASGTLAAHNTNNAGTGNTGSAGGHTPSGTNAQVSAGTPAGSVTVASNGVAVTNKNLQPYITCYMWKRTA
jgi:hypothetical protein